MGGGGIVGKKPTGSKKNKKARERETNKSYQVKQTSR